MNETNTNNDAARDAGQKYSAIVEIFGGKVREIRPIVKLVNMIGAEWSPLYDEHSAKNQAAHEAATSPESLTVRVLEIGQREGMHAKMVALCAARKAARQKK